MYIGTVVDIVLVKADTREPQNSRWYTGGGLFRDVHLIITDPQQYFTRNSLYITTPKVGDSEAIVAIQAEIACDIRTKDFKVNTKIYDATGKVVYDQDKNIAFNRKQIIREYPIDSFAISHPSLWSCEPPYLYKAELTLYRADGTVADRVSENFGIRSIEFSPEFSSSRIPNNILRVTVCISPRRRWVKVRLPLLSRRR